MSWFGSADPVAELEAKIVEATSEAIPNGELDIAVGLEITDIIRSKKVPPKQAMRSLKKRLTKIYANPNLLGSTLKLIDLCVKNCGAHFLVELNCKEFVDYLVDYIFRVHYDVRSFKVQSSEAKLTIGNDILKFVKEWALCFKNQFELNYLDKVYNQLLKQNYTFPEVDQLVTQFASNFIDSEAPPDWIDGKECMICYTPFSVMNRKHHCRACGGVFCQTHSGNNIPLVSMGIMQPSRVCDDCHQIHKNKSGAPAARGFQSASRNVAPADDEDEQLRRALELSMQDAQVPVSYAPPPPASEPEEEMDADLKAAIAASLQEYKAQEPYYPQPQEPELPSYEAELDFYQNILPFDTNPYADAPLFSTQPARNQAPEHLQMPNHTQSTPQHSSQQPSQPNPQAQHTQQPQFTLSQQPQFTLNQQPQLPSQSMTPAQHMEQHKPQEDLTSQEEESINLFIQLMNGIKNDRSKQASILHDQNLSELHSKVIQLKPKLNRSLRTSIEKYEFFLEMNNKISSITRLYDLFLEAKLNQAYNKHYVSPQYSRPQYTGMPYAPPQSQPAPSGPQPSGPQLTGLQSTDPQSTGPQRTGPQPPQTTGPHFSMPPTTFPTGQEQFVTTSSQPFQPSMPYPMEDSRSYQSNNYSAEERFQAEKFPAESSTSIPKYDTLRGSYPGDTGKIPSEPEYPEFAKGPYQFQNNDIPAYPSEPDYGSEPEEQPQQPQFTGGYPTEPSYPPDESDVSENESVASRFPPIEETYRAEPDAEAPTEHASTRYPAIDDLEDADLDLPEVPASLSRFNTSESKKFEPEPLIEL